MDQETIDTDYDVIVLGTGITECILSGLLSVDGKRYYILTSKTIMVAKLLLWPYLNCMKNLNKIRSVKRNGSPSLVKIEIECRLNS